MFLNLECGLMGWYVWGIGIDFGFVFFLFSMVEFNICMIVLILVVWIFLRVIFFVWGLGECLGKEFRFFKINFIFKF